MTRENDLRLVEQSGFSLVELMIAMALGVLLMFGVLQVFNANMQSAHLQNAYARVQENGRMATELMVRDIRVADFWGCTRDTSSIVNHLDTSDPDYDPTLNPAGTSGVTGEDNVTSTIIGTITVKDGTDTVTLRGAQALPKVKVVPPYMTVSSAAIHISTGVIVPQGKIIMLSDCVGADLIANTTSNTDTSGTITHNTSELSIAGSVPNAIKDLSHTYETSAQIIVPYLKTYFIGQNTAGSYSLFRSDDGVAKELVRGVNDLQLVYGEDTSGNGSADLFTGAASVTDMDTVRSIRVGLVTESGASSSGTPLEKAYTVTANIRNRTL